MAVSSLARESAKILKFLEPAGQAVLPIVGGGLAVAVVAPFAGKAVGDAAANIGTGAGAGLQGFLSGGDTQSLQRFINFQALPDQAFKQTPVANTGQPMSIPYKTTDNGVQIVQIPTQAPQTQNNQGLPLVPIFLIAALALGGIYVFTKK